MPRLFADGNTSALADLLETGRRDCRHLDQQLEPLVLEIELKVNELADIFSLALPDGLEYRDVLAEAHRQMAQVATQAAEDLLRHRVEENGDVDEDWLFDDLDSLTEALSEACAEAIEREPAADAAAGQRQRPPAIEAATWPTQSTGCPAAVTSVPPARARPTADHGYMVPAAAPNLLDRLTGIVAVCRPARRPLSLLLVKLSAAEELSAACGPQETVAIRQVLGKVCTKIDHPAQSACRTRNSDLPSFCPGRNGSRRLNWATIWFTRSAFWRCQPG